jgi:hypothetical protein
MSTRPVVIIGAVGALIASIFGFIRSLRRRYQRWPGVVDFTNTATGLIRVEEDARSFAAIHHNRGRVHSPSGVAEDRSSLNARIASVAHGHRRSPGEFLSTLGTNTGRVEFDLAQ